MINVKVLKNIIIRDVINGFSQNKTQYFLFVLFIAIITISSGNALKNEHANIVDIFFLNYKDIGYVINNEGMLNIPMNWLMINMFIAFIIGNFLSKDLQEMSVYILMRTKRFREYWIAKVCWIAINILVIYSLLFIVTYCIGSIFVDTSIEWSLFSQRIIQNQLLMEITGGELLTNLLLLYCMTSFTVSLLQVNLSLFVDSKYSFLLILLILSSSIVVDNQLLPGIHSMILKHEYFDDIHNLTIGKSVLYNFILSLIFSCTGYLKIIRKDII